MYSHTFINKVYVINLKRRSDRWTTLQKAFAHTGLTLIRWNATLGTTIPSSQLKQLVTPSCYQFCPRSIIGVWLSHYRLWQHIAKHKETNVLILEDDAYPSSDFPSALNSIFPSLPSNWDLLFLGCYGSCVLRQFAASYSIFKPSFPLALHSYMITCHGAQKLINALHTPYYTIDFAMASFFLCHPDFKVFAVKPNLIYQNTATDYSDNQNFRHIVHPLALSLSSKIPIIQGVNLDCFLFGQLFYVRSLKFTFTYMMLYLSIITLILNRFGHQYIHFYKSFILCFILLELFSFSNSISFHRLTHLGIEAFIIFFLISISSPSPNLRSTSHLPLSH